MSNLHDSYTRILFMLHEIVAENYFVGRIRFSKLSDKKLIAPGWAAECSDIDSERNLNFKLIS